MSKHTALPWSVGETSVGQGNIYGADHNIVALINDSYSNATGNRALIVRAANNHQALIEALEAMLKAHPPECVTYLHGPSWKQVAREKAEAALAAAKEGA